MKMYIADRNVFGIDLNPIAIELAEVSLWLNTIHRGAYVPWFGQQLVRGNSLIGGRRDVWTRDQVIGPHRGWLKDVPSRVRVGEARQEGAIWHFLLPDEGMAVYGEGTEGKPIRDLYKTELGKIDAWRKVVTSGHREAVRWLASPEFALTKRVYDTACGQGAIYFRVVDGAIHAIALHPGATGYVGHRANHEDDSFVLKPSMAVPTVADVIRKHAAFEAWMPTVLRKSAEEQAVIPWLRRALQNELKLPEMGSGWVFLNQEWRFIGDDGKGKKSDVLAVHLPSGKLGIVEAKSSAAQRLEAERQVRDYQRYWIRDQKELAPLFTQLLRAMGHLYGNEEAARSTVSMTPSAAFFLAPAGSQVVVSQL